MVLLFVYNKTEINKVLRALDIWEDDKGVGYMVMLSSAEVELFTCTKSDDELGSLVHATKFDCFTIERTVLCQLSLFVWV